jgi:RND family efflux transporter MFP subunit
VENHEQVRQKETVVRLIDTAEREMEINIPEKFIISMLEGGSSLKFKVYLDAFPDRIFSASIKEIGTEASSTTQTYPITLTMEDVPVELSLLAGMNGRAILEGNRDKNVPQQFKVPASAIFTQNLNQSFVWVIDTTSHTVHKKGVEISPNSQGDFVTIEKGLSQGDWIVIAGTSFLSEGQKVKFAPEQSPP